MPAKHAPLLLFVSILSRVQSLTSPGILASRTLRVELDSLDANAGIGEGSANVNTVTYSGKR